MSRRSGASSWWWGLALASGGVVVYLGLRAGWWESPLRVPDEPADVVLYSSVDGPILDPIVRSFTEKTGIKVRVVGDTEATKTVGLVERLIAEKPRPRADVWWSNEPLGSITLARQGVLDRGGTEVAKGWPSEWRSSDGAWVGHALRARVIAYNTNRLHREEVPRRLRDLAAERFEGKVGLANPAFGTTRLHLAALVALAGEEPTRAWLRSMRDRGARIYDGNSGVVQALAFGEIEVGLTDTDDVHAAERNGWPVSFVYEEPDSAGDDTAGLKSFGPLAIPSTAGRIAGSPHPVEGAMLFEFILSPEVERMLAASEARHVPIRPEIAREFPDLSIPGAIRVDPASLVEALPTATRLAAEVLGRR